MDLQKKRLLVEQNWVQKQHKTKQEWLPVFPNLKVCFTFNLKVVGNDLI